MKIIALHCMLLFCFLPNQRPLLAQQVAIVDLDSIYWVLWKPSEQITTREQYEIRLQAYQHKLDTISAQFHQLYEQLINDPNKEKDSPNPMADTAKRRSYEQVNAQLLKKFEALRQQQKAVILQELIQANRKQYQLLIEKSSILYLAEEEFSLESAPLNFSERIIKMVKVEQLEQLVPGQKLVYK
ncbi:MAG: hypothetical protein KTR30_34005 [Saprospiraceae bacterium]|nr:hypothetical protein [Saprospiraceae bacterium]